MAAKKLLGVQAVKVVLPTWAAPVATAAMRLMQFMVVSNLVAKLGKIR
jgi:hypothetical protein